MGMLSLRKSKRNKCSLVGVWTAIDLYFTDKILLAHFLGQNDLRIFMPKLHRF